MSINTPDRWDPAATPEQLARRDERIQATFAEIYPEASARGFDGVAQLADMDIEGVDLGFLYPSFGLFVIASNEIDADVADRRRARVQRLDGRLLRGDPARLRGLGMIALHDPDAGGRRGAARARRARLPAACSRRPNPILGRNLDDPAYEPVWKALSNRGWRSACTRAGCRRSRRPASDRLTNAEQRHICSHPMEQMVAAVSLIYGGVLERFPGLRVAFLEAGCGWVPFWLERMDDHYEKGLERDFGAAKLTSRCRRASTSAGSASSRPTPTRRCSRTVIEVLGDERIVFSTDYPHPDSKYPHAVDCFLGLARRERRQQAHASSGTMRSRCTASTNPPRCRDVGARSATILRRACRPTLVELTQDVLFGDVWERPQLSKRDRSIATLAVLIAKFRTDELRSHIHRALDNGVTEEEIGELICHLALTAGGPPPPARANVARAAFD